MYVSHRSGILFGEVCEITKQVVLFQGIFINNSSRTFGAIGEILASNMCRIKTLRSNVTKRCVHRDCLDIHFLWKVCTEPFYRVLGVCNVITHA